MEPHYESDHRFKITADIKALATPGILVRPSDGRGPLNIPFMRWVSKYTQSEYTHAATLFFDDGEPWVLEVTDTGTMLYRFIDWLTFVPGDNFKLYEVPGIDGKRLNVICQYYYGLDLNYDSTFEAEDRAYCTENVCNIFHALGVHLMKPMKLKEIVSAYVQECTGGTSYAKHLRYVGVMTLLTVGNFICKKFTKGKYGLPLSTPLYFVGNEKRGILSHKSLRCIYEGQKNSPPSKL